MNLAKLLLLTVFLQYITFPQNPQNNMVRGGQALVRTSITDDRAWNGECWGDMGIAATMGRDAITVQQFRQLMKEGNFSPCIETVGKGDDQSYTLCVPEKDEPAAQDRLFTRDDINRTCMAYPIDRTNNEYGHLATPNQIWLYSPSSSDVRTRFGQEGLAAFQRLKNDVKFGMVCYQKKVICFSMGPRDLMDMSKGKLAYDFFVELKQPKPVVLPKLGPGSQQDHRICRFQVLPTGPVWCAGYLAAYKRPVEFGGLH